MAVPVNRSEFKEYCLRRLGKTAIKVNVTDPQIEDRIDEALLFWKDYHYEARYMTYVKHEITQQNIDDKFIVLPNNIISVVKVFNTDIGITSGIFSLRYQLHLNDLYDLSSTNLSNFVIAQQYVNLIQDVLSPQSAIRFQSVEHTLRFDAETLYKFRVGQFIILEIYTEIDENVYTDIWRNRTLADLATAMIKRQWGENLKKYQGIVLPGGSTLNGQVMYTEAVEEIKDLKQTFINLYQDPVNFVVA